MRNWTLLLMVAVVLQGCGPYYITDTQLGGIKPGMSAGQVQSQLSKEPDATFPVTGLGGIYDVQVYRLLTGQRQQMTMSCTKYGCVPIPYTEPVTEPYVFVYQSSELVAWGFVEQLRKAPNKELNTLGADVAAELQKRNYL